MELNLVQDICEMLHEFLKIDDSVTIEVSRYGDSYNVLFRHIKAGTFAQTLAIFRKAQSTITIPVIPFKCPEKLMRVEGFGDLVL